MQKIANNILKRRYIWFYIEIMNWAYNIGIKSFLNIIICSIPHGSKFFFAIKNYSNFCHMSYERDVTQRCKGTNFAADISSVTIWKAHEATVRQLSPLSRSKSEVICEKARFVFSLIQNSNNAKRLDRTTLLRQLT